MSDIVRPRSYASSGEGRSASPVTSFAMPPYRNMSDFVKSRPSSDGGGSGDDSSSIGNFSLRTSAPTAPSSIEDLAERLFSLDHLKYILKDPLILARFNSFLALYRPRLALSLRKYLDVQKAIAAVRYANSLANTLWPGLEAAPLDPAFESKSKMYLDDLLSEGLPGYITHRVTEQVTAVMNREITGHNTAATEKLVRGLAEVYCLTDPAVPDNPIVYASEGTSSFSRYRNTD